MIERLEDAGEILEHPLVLSRMRGVPIDRAAQMLGEERCVRLRDGEHVAVFEDRTLGRFYGVVFDIDLISEFTWAVLEYLFITTEASELIFDSIGEDAGYQFGAYHAGIKLSQLCDARWQWKLEKKWWQKIVQERERAEAYVSVPHADTVQPARQSRERRAARAEH